MPSEPVREISTKDGKALRDFIVLERQILGGYPLYVSNYDQDVTRYLSGKSAFTRDMEISLFVACDDRGDVACCATLVNPRYQEAKNEKVGFIGYFAAAPDCVRYVEVMLKRAEGWLKERGIRRVIAPYNGNVALGTGFLTAAFEEEPVMFASWNPPYYIDYFIQAGYEPSYPLWIYTIDLASEKFQAAEKRALTNQSVRVRPIDKRQWHSDLEIFREMINDTFSNEWEWYPLTQEEFCKYFDQIKIMVDPHQMLIAEVQGTPVGIWIAFPNWNPLTRGMQGRLGLWQQMQFFWRGRHYDAAGCAFAAVMPEYRGMGISSLLGVHLCHHYQELGVKKIFYYFVNENNHRSRRAAESIGGVGRVVYHTYDKVIT